MYNLGISCEIKAFEISNYKNQKNSGSIKDIGLEMAISLNRVYQPTWNLKDNLYFKGNGEEIIINKVNK